MESCRLAQIYCFVESTDTLRKLIIRATTYIYIRNSGHGTRITLCRLSGMHMYWIFF